MSNESKLIYPNCDPPLLDSVNKIVSCFIVCEVVLEFALGGVPDPHGIESMHFVILHQIFEHSEISHRCPSETMQCDQMRQFRCFIHCVDFVDVIYFVHSNRSVIDFFAQLETWEVQSFLQCFLWFQFVDELFLQELRIDCLILTDHQFILW